MSKNPNSGGGKPYADPHQDRARYDKRDVTGSIHVRGEIETKIPTDLAKKRDAAEEKKETRDRHRFWVEVAGLIFIIVYAGLTAWQADTTQKIAHLTEQQMITSQRPWVGTDLKEPVILIADDGKKIEWHVNFKNYGNSPALHVRWHTHLAINHLAPLNWSKIESDTERLDLSQDMEYTMFTGQELPNQGVNEKPIPDGLNAQLANGTNQVLVTGLVQYMDEFDKEHTTTFCLIYNPPRGGIAAGYIVCPVKPLAN